MTPLAEATRATTAAGPQAPPRPRRRDAGVVAWCAAAVALLVGSGVFRAVQADRISDPSEYLAQSPFPLREIPKVIDTWKVVEGGDVLLDPQTARITGSTDHISRTYCDDLTGVTLSVLILYGPLEPVTPHTPQVCYPASGFAPVGDTIDLKVPYGQGKSADFRTSVFGKSGGRSVLLQTVYHSYELNGVWSPTIDNSKLPRRNPGVFKVQIQRRSYEQETRGENEPIEAFLSKLLPVIETLTAEAQAKATAAKAAPAPPRPA